MARSQHDSMLTEQYVTLSQTCPRRLAEPLISNDAADTATPERAEAEWSLRRIEARIGSVA
ncbi:hypothetical protein KPG71_01460 [Roseovarius sp. PS-C2]|uniref:hypothetical protein n=1 Tax=Roseovarius sp. PS-C2 TaxID=2820814 RepID=UPI001C0AB389|nr:hypothetical protein [Roseovarius sp. PS-C2]MBU3258674.1 hypothetical protein [Roseovarius sp. PS-C2]